MSESMLSSVAATAYWVAAGRAMESEAQDALFRDPYARALAGERGFAMLEPGAMALSAGAGIGAGAAEDLLPDGGAGLSLS
jgi:O-methyltransferase involved in polyketide biosynthesis